MSTASLASGLDAPKVSVVVPTHDRPDRLQKALESVRSQTYPNLEVIVVDDASSVPAKAIVEDVLQQLDFQLVRLERNRGASGARNEGISRASGDVVAFIDDDDRWAPTKVARQVEYLRSHPEVGLVTCDHFIERENSKRRPRRFRGPERVNTEQMLWVNFVGSFSFVMARLDLLRTELRIDETFWSVEDWDLWLRCSRLAAIGCVNEALVHHVFHGGDRLSAQQHRRPGLELFLSKHREAMSPDCVHFHLAHQRMEAGSGFSKRVAVARSLPSGAGHARRMLLLEQATRQLGRALGDPGLSYRALARVV